MKISEKYLVVKKNKKNIFEFFKNIIEKIFNKGKKNEILSTSKVKVIQKQNFDEKIKYIDKYELEKSLKFKIDKDEIKISDLTNYEKEKMIKFYRAQIVEKEKKLEEVKKRILKLKNI